MVLAAILNSPLANAYMYFHEGRRDNRIITLRSIPLPHLDELDTDAIVERVSDYSMLVQEEDDHLQSGKVYREALSLLLEIDSLVLKSYDLSPKQERKVLDLFHGYPRPVPMPFTHYYPADFTPFVPLHEYISPQFKQISAANLTKRIDPMRDAEVHEILADVVY